MIVQLNGHEVRDAAHLSSLLGLVRAGGEVDLAYYRDGRMRRAHATVQGLHQAAVLIARAVPQLAGAALREIDRDEQAFGRIDGVLIAEVERGSPAWRYGLRGGDIITGVNRRPVASLKDVAAALDEGHRALVLDLVRGNARLALVIQ